MSGSADLSNSNNRHSLCINPTCPEFKRLGDEQPCTACGSDLLLNERYRVTGVLNQRRDNVSVVFDVIDVTDGENSKVLKVVYTDSEEAIRRFNREADVLLNHWVAGLPRVEQGGYFHVEFPKKQTPAYCLVMEKIDGMNLQQWLESRNNHPITEQVAIDWLKQLVKILGKLHGQNFSHRDIKPSNIMRRNRDGKLVLIDLGCVRAVTQAVRERRDVTRIGTNGYSAPEQLTRGELSTTADFYALGRTFVHLLTGEYPNDLPQDSPEKLRWRPSAPRISKLLADLIDNLMEWSPNNRPQTTEDILRRLEDIERTLHRRKRPRLPTFKQVLGLIVFVLVLLVGFIGIRSGTNQADKNGSVPSPTTGATPDPRCKTLKETRTINDNALAIDVGNLLRDKQASNSNSEISKLVVSNITQIGCDLNIYVSLKDGYAFTPELKKQMEDMIKNEFNYVGGIRIVETR